MIAFAALCFLIASLSIASSANTSAPAAPSDSAFQKNVDGKKPKRRPRASGPTITPANPAVTPGTPITLTSSAPVTWSLNGVGTLSNQTSTSVTYTAPASVVSRHQMLGCPVLPNDTVFNTPVDALPLDPNSSNMIAAQSSVQLSFQPSWGISYADASTPTRTFLPYYGAVPHPNFVFPNQGPNLKREAGDYVGIFSYGANVPDHHVMTVRRTDCTFYESYDDYTDGYLRTCGDGVTPNCNVQSVVNYASTTYNFTDNWGTDAGGFLLAPLTWHVDEIKSGVINHAVRFTEGTGGIQFGVVRWPASATAGGCSPCTNSFPMGTRLRLKSSFDVSSFSTYAQTVLQALKKYGMILTDTGSNNAAQVSDDVWDDPAVGTALLEVFNAHVGISNFEVVDESSLQFAPSSYAVCPMNATCMGAQNTFVQPLSQAMITATPTSGAASSVPVAIQGIAIGLGVPYVLPVQSGSYSFQIPYWVNGTTNTAVNWTLQSGVGSVTTAGVYTPPTGTANIGTIAPTVLKGTSAADPNVTTLLYLTVLPSGASPAGSIRIDTGAAANNTDGNGNVWLADIGLDGAFETAYDYPAWKTADPLRLIYQSETLAYGNELRYQIAVPNGNYRVHLLFGALLATCPNSPCSTWPGNNLDIHTFNPQILETQGGIKLRYFDWGQKAGYAYFQPEDVYIPAKVTNNILNVGLYSLAPDAGPVLAPANGSKLNTLNGIEILPDASAPHWTIDTQQQSTISAGQTLRPFSITDWYTGATDPTWTIVSGPPGASLNASTLTLASGKYFNGQPIVVKAADATYSATATIYTAGGTNNPLAIVATPAPVNHFSYKRTITVSHTQITADQTNFPLEVSVVDPTLEPVSNGGHVLEAHGYDIVLTSDAAGATKLNWEVEKYDPNSGTWVGHVKIPTLSHTTDTVIYMFYGNPVINSDQSTPAAVWDSNYKGVYHFATVTSTTTSDSTSNANKAVNNVSVTGSPAGKIGAAALFGGSGTAYHLEFPPAVLNAAAGTISGWFNSTLPTTSGQNFGTAAQTDSSKTFRFLEWFTYYSGSLFGWNSGTDYTINIPSTQLNIPVNTWTHVAYTWNQSANTQVVYLNGSPVKTVSTAFTGYTPVSNFWLGTDPANQAYSYGGLMDEVRFSNTSRSAVWIAAEYANQNAPSSFAVLGTEAAN